MTDTSNETSKIPRHRSLRFKNRLNTSTDYQLPSLRAKPRRKQSRGNSSDNDSNSDTGDANDSEHDELSDSSSEGSDMEEDSDNGSVFSMDEVDDMDNEEELANPSRSKDRQRRRQLRQQHDTLTGNNTKLSRKRQADNDEQVDDDSKQLKQKELATSSKGSPNHHPKRRKLRPTHTIRSTTIYNDFLSDDSEWMDQDVGIQYPSDMDIVMNERRGKSTNMSPLVLGSPSKVMKTHGDGDQKQQLGNMDKSAAILSPDRIDPSRQSSSSSIHGTSPLSKLDEKKWPRRPQASAFLDKLQAKEMDTLDLSQHSFIPDDFLESQHNTIVTTTTSTTTGSRNVRMEKHTTLLMKNGGGLDDMSDSDDMAYQYDFSTISEPSSMTINPTTSDTISDDQSDIHTHQISTNPPTPTPTPNTTKDEQQQPPSFFRRITRFFFG